jgi:hypothetical protein
MATRRDPDINENYLHDEYTDDELNEAPETDTTGITGPFAAGVTTGGTLGGGGDLGDRSFRDTRGGVVRGWDSNGSEVAQDRALEGTVGGNTNAAQALVGEPTGPRVPLTPEEDLGPEGTIVQELGGEARH